jgi:surface antigen
MTYAQSSYTPGQCTWYVAGTNSWIPPGLGNAAQWLTNAPAKGLRVGKTPAPGAVAVLEPGTPGLNVSVDGHVMDVISVNGDSVTVRDMNWNYKPFQTTTHTLAASSISGYIYPPGGIVPSTSVAASDLGASTSAPISSLPFGGFFQGLGSIFPPFNFSPTTFNPNATGSVGSQVIGDTTGGLTSGIGTIFGTVFTFITKGGEVLIGFVAIIAGMFILVKHSSAGNNVINVVTSTAKTGAKLAA